MKQIPILFSDPMALATTEGRKTQTRRLRGLQMVNKNPDEWQFIAFGPNPDNENDKGYYAYLNIKNTDTWTYVRCPYGMPGDVLWVREAWAGLPTVGKNGLETEYIYRAAGESVPGVKWKPSIHMPRIACRTFLKVKAIRLERLNTIADADAIAEGIEFLEHDAIDENNPAYRSYKNYLPGKDFITLCDDAGYSWNDGKETHTAAVASYCSLWCEINGTESWNANPWVWVVEYELTTDPDSCKL